MLTIWGEALPIHVMVYMYGRFVLIEHRPRSGRCIPNRGSNRRPRTVAGLDRDGAHGHHAVLRDELESPRRGKGFKKTYCFYEVV